MGKHPKQLVIPLPSRKHQRIEKRYCQFLLWGWVTFRCGKSVQCVSVRLNEPGVLSSEPNFSRRPCEPSDPGAFDTGIQTGPNSSHTNATLVRNYTVPDDQRASLYHPG
jgi:hypothetical protein